MSKGRAAKSHWQGKHQNESDWLRSWKSIGIQQVWFSNLPLYENQISNKSAILIVACCWKKVLKQNLLIWNENVLLRLAVTNTYIFLCIIHWLRVTELKLWILLQFLALGEFCNFVMGHKEFAHMKQWYCQQLFMIKKIFLLSNEQLFFVTLTRVLS